MRNGDRVVDVHDVYEAGVVDLHLDVVERRRRVDLLLLLLIDGCRGALLHRTNAANAVAAFAAIYMMHVVVVVLVVVVKMLMMKMMMVMILVRVRVHVELGHFIVDSQTDTKRWAPVSSSSSLLLAASCSIALCLFDSERFNEIQQQQQQQQMQLDPNSRV